MISEKISLYVIAFIFPITTNFFSASIIQATNSRNNEINSGETTISVNENVHLTQKDINEFQLAKAAIAAGLEILCKSISIQLSDIQNVYIAGGFGNYINIQHLVQTGMIELPEVKIHKMGNTALIGAKMFLFSNDEIVNDILSITKHINLESDPNFQNIYVDKMLFL